MIVPINFNTCVYTGSTKSRVHVQVFISNQKATLKFFSFALIFFFRSINQSINQNLWNYFTNQPTNTPMTTTPFMSLAEKTAYKRNLVKIRLARFGRRHQPVYNIVVMPAKKAPQKLPLEVIGTYDPIPLPKPSHDNSAPVKEINLDFHRAKYWLGQGAEPTDRVAWLFKKAGLLPSFWPKESKLSQEIIKPVIEDIKETQEVPVERIRRR